MAESQVPFAYTPEKMAAIRATLSEARFSSYLTRAGGHEAYAIALYLYNARVAKAFLYPLQIVEVTLRNAIDQVLIELYGADWHAEPKFVDHVLLPEGRSTLLKACGRVGPAGSHNQVVAALTFDFWSNMLRSDYGDDIWRWKLHDALPHLPNDKTRHDVQHFVRAINEFRNRVAHHEPVLDLNINDVHSKIVALVSWRDGRAASWLRHHSTVSAIVRQRPKLSGVSGPFLASRMDDNFLICAPSASLFKILNDLTPVSVAIVCLDDKSNIVGAITHFDLVQYIKKVSGESEGLVDLNEHSVASLLDTPDLISSWTTFDQAAPLAGAIAELKKPRIRILVAVDKTNAQPAGVVVRAHRRY